MRILRVFLVLCIITLVGASAFAISADKQPLTFQISADKHNYVVGEQITLIFQLTNITRRRIKSDDGLTLSLFYRNPKLFYRKHNQEFINLMLNNAGLVDMVFPPEELAPGESKSNIEGILYAKQPVIGLVLSEPGHYQFRAEYYFKGQTLESNTIDIVVQPVPESEKQAFNQWNDPELLDFLQGNVGFVSKDQVANGMRKAVIFLEEHSSSIYAKPVKQGLLKYLESRGIQRSEEEKRVYERLQSYKIE